MKKTKPQIINYKSFAEKSGTLSPFYIGNHIPKNFKLKRFFFFVWEKKIFKSRPCS